MRDDVNETATAWECANCGRDNEGDTCLLCGASELPLAAEAERAAELLRQAEAEFSAQLGMPIQLTVVGGTRPTTVAEAEALIAEMRAEVQDQLAEGAAEGAAEEASDPGVCPGRQNGQAGTHGYGFVRS